MDITQIWEKPWKILPEKLVHLVNSSAKIQEHLLIEKVYDEYEEETLTKKDDRIGIIDIKGSLVKDASKFEKFLYGYTTYSDIESSLAKLIAEKDIDRILLRIDSPGGSAQGAQELSDYIFSVRGKKPIDSWTDGTMASAAYEIGSAADKIYISSDSTMVGSIGVVAMHVDVSKMLENAGITVNELTAGKYKRIASTFKPLSEEGREYLQDILDSLYVSFVDTVSRNRGVKQDKVLSDMADGRIFIGRKAIDAGLVDGVMTFSQVKNKGKGKSNVYFKGGSIVDKLTLEQIKAQYSEELSAFEKEISGKVTKELETKFDMEKKSLESNAKSMIEKMSLQLEETNKRIVLMEKQELERKGKEIQFVADQVWQAKLEASDLPKEAYPKAKSQVDVKMYIKDGALDIDAFSKAVDAELDTWKFLPRTTSAVMGSGSSNRELKSDPNKEKNKENKELVDMLFSLSGKIGRKEDN